MKLGAIVLILVSLIAGTSQAVTDAPGRTKHATLAEIEDLLAEVQVTLAAGEAILEKSKGEWRWKQCRFQSLENRIWSDREERLTAECAARRFDVGLETFFRIGSCESGWNRLAYNPAGPYLGIFQHAANSWAGRVRAYRPRGWGIEPAWTNSRTQVVVSARMMRDVGTSPWGCA